MPIQSDSPWHSKNDFRFILNPVDEDATDIVPLRGNAQSVPRQEPNGNVNLGSSASSDGSSGSPACYLKQCCVCTEGLPACYSSPATWAEICHLTMYALSLENPEQQYFHIRKHICEFIDAHYDLLVQKERSSVWKQTVNMTLSHPQYASLFVQELSLPNGRKGFYGLREVGNPYARINSVTKRRKRSPSVCTKKRRCSDDGIAVPVEQEPQEELKNSKEITDLKVPKTEEKDANEELKTKADIKRLEMEVFMYFAKHSSPDLHENDSDDADLSDELNQSKSKRGRQATKPEEKEVLEQYYTYHFQKYAKHTRRAKSELEELAKKLGWKVNRIQRWLDNRRTKDKTKGESDSDPYSRESSFGCAGTPNIVNLFKQEVF